jgi:predicted DCC family thiol-disulfide oxidoreductase YuxK
MCALCDGWVDFILRYDRDSIFRFSALQSEAGRAILKRIDPQQELGGGSIVLVEDEQVYCRSTAILRILRGLGLPFSPAYVAIAVPRSIRDYIYDVIAVHRLNWFGERETCRIPTPAELSRFL